MVMTDEVAILTALNERSHFLLWWFGSAELFIVIYCTYLTLTDCLFNFKGGGHGP